MEDYIVTYPDGKYELVDCSGGEEEVDKLEKFCKEKGLEFELVHARSIPVEDFIS